MPTSAAAASSNALGLPTLENNLGTSDTCALCKKLDPMLDLKRCSVCNECYHLSTCLDLHGDIGVDWLCGNCDGDARPTKLVVDITEDTDVLHYLRQQSYPPDKTEQQKSRIRYRAQ